MMVVDERNALLLGATETLSNRTRTLHSSTYNMNKPSPFFLIVLFSRTLVHSGALERITTDHTDLSFELGLGPDGTMARGLWRLARLAAAHFCARGICISIFQRPMVSERSALAAGGGLDDVPAAYLILWRGILIGRR